MGGDTTLRIPLKNKPPLLINKYRVQAFKIANQHFKTIAGWDPKIGVAGRIVQQL
jgi:hypothetical protein